MGKVQFLFFRSFLPILTKLSFWGEYWALNYDFTRFLYFLDISYIPKILNLKSFGNLYTSCLLLIIILLFTCGERKIWSNTKKSQNIMIMIADVILIYFRKFFNYKTSFEMLFSIGLVILKWTLNIVVTK